ncbi:MAG: hypothetical protein BWX61_00854 [Bacteroidetes bacterium ADurb.Bin035]|nr:MAG: hypothetical protein BWX61_00854 [Bacteroidetes bacterium ADurb.Bin035]
MAPIPILTGIPVHRYTVSLIFLAYSCNSMYLYPLRFRKASSMLYISISGENSASIFITLELISPYSGKLVEKTLMLYFSISSFSSKAGLPIGIPMALASLLRDITHPSLFDKTTTGLPFSDGSKTLSQDT